LAATRGACWWTSSIKPASIYDQRTQQSQADHSQLKHRLKPMRGLRTDRTAQVIIAVHAFMQHLRRGHYELVVETTGAERVATAFTELTLAI
jgi:hypothetical protein